MSDTEKATATMPDLSEEQMNLLRKRFQMEQQVAEQAQAGKVLPDIGAEHIYTNITNEGLIVPDLGIGVPGQSFTPEYFPPHESKDLGQIYTAREIKRSKHLALFITRDKKIVKGFVPREQHQHNQDPLEALARANVDSSVAFADPARVPLNNKDGDLEASTDYDRKLKELRDKDIREERESRQGE